jgi:hypothetical protein
MRANERDAALLAAYTPKPGKRSRVSIKASMSPMLIAL